MAENVELPEGFVLDELPPGFVLDQPRPTIQRPQQESPVPQWGIDNPNAYGMYGAARGLMSQAVKPSLETAGMILGGGGGMAVANPLLGGALGYGIGRKVGEIGENWLASFEQPIPSKTVSEEVLSSGKDVALAYLAGKSTELAAKGLGAAENIITGNVPNKVQQLGQKHGIRTTLGEETANPNVQKSETWMENVPWLGLRKFRLGQQEDVKRAANEQLAKYVYDPTSETTAVIKEANDAYLDSLYKAVKKSGKTLPSVQPMEVKQTTAKILDQYPAIFESIQDNHVKGILRNIASDVRDKTIVSNIVNSSGKPYVKIEPVITDFNELWTLRKGLGKEMNDAKTDTARGVYSQLYKAVSEDMNTMFAGTKVGNQFKQANDAFIQYSVKFDAMRQAYDKALGTTSASEMFSPKKFSTELKKLANDPNYKRNVKWTQNEIDEMTGLANIMQVVKRGGQFAENPPTGNRWGVPVVALEVGNMMVHGGSTGYASAAGLISASVIGRFLTSSPVGKRLAISAANVDPMSPTMQSIISTTVMQASNYMKLQLAEQEKSEVPDMGPRARVSLVPKQKISKTAQDYLQRVR